jgi:hypothetical protein
VVINLSCSASRSKLPFFSCLNIMKQLSQSVT